MLKEMRCLSMEFKAIPWNVIATQLIKESSTTEMENVFLILLDLLMKEY